MENIYVIDSFLSIDKTNLINSYMEQIINHNDEENILIDTRSSVDEVSSIIAAASASIRNMITEKFGVEVDIINCSYIEMHEGSSNDLHSDLFHLDGTPYDDGQNLEFSGLIYLNDGETDFTGGNIVFPNQNFSFTPKAGSLIFFSGDLEHIHEVEVVRSGIRKNIVLFFDKKDAKRESLLNSNEDGIKMFIAIKW